MTREEAKAWFKVLLKDKYAFNPVDREAFKIAIEALEQEPQLVLYSGDGYADGYMVYDMAECPNCGYEYEEDDKDWKEPFCPHCGQVLDWGMDE